MSTDLEAAFGRLKAGQKVQGISATLLPYGADGEIDWAAFEGHIVRTRDAGLDVAVNMDTGFGDLLADDQRVQVLDTTRRILGAGTVFYAGAYPDFTATDPLPSYSSSMRAVTSRGAVPVIVQSPVTHRMNATERAALYRRLAGECERVVAFELGKMFAPHGEIWDHETFERILDIPQIVGSKHSSLDRAIELNRLAARDRLRPDFRVYTGNDLAIDMVAYGSDYLLGLSTFAPASFARRDAALAAGEIEFSSLNDALQHLGNVGFRQPVPAYKHAAAQFLHITGLLDSDHIHPRAPRRPASDRILLFDCARRLGLLDDPEKVYAERVEAWV